VPNVRLTTALKEEYQRLFNTCEIRKGRMARVERCLTSIMGNQGRYEAVSVATGGIPWYVIAAIHNMESSLRFTCHLHNGDPLTARTRHVPAGRPKSGKPPFAWEDSAADALRYQGLHRWKDWSLSGTLYKLEAFNGWGYRLYHPHVLSPYLWSSSMHYSSGKYVADGTWSDTAVSQQIGAAVILRRMAETGIIAFSEVRVGQPILRYAGNKELPHAEELQRFLNQLPGIYVQVDGKPGRKTSDAFHVATGYYLAGDPRA